MRTVRASQGDIVTVVLISLVALVIVCGIVAVMVWSDRVTRRRAERRREAWRAAGSGDRGPDDYLGRDSGFTNFG